jgi:hypothetical protein
MSDIGAHANVYQRLRHYGDLLDEVLVQLKAGIVTAGDEKRQRLAALLVATKEQRPASLEAAWLNALFRTQKLARFDWSTIATLLIEPGREAEAIVPLEDLARSLEGWRAETANRMRGLDA